MIEADGYDGIADSLRGYDEWCAWRRLGLLLDNAIGEAIREFGIALAEVRVLTLAERVAMLMPEGRR